MNERIDIILIFELGFMVGFLLASSIFIIAKQIEISRFEPAIHGERIEDTLKKEMLTVLSAHGLSPSYYIFWRENVTFECRLSAQHLDHSDISVGTLLDVRSDIQRLGWNGYCDYPIQEVVVKNQIWIEMHRDLEVGVV